MAMLRRWRSPAVAGVASNGRSQRGYTLLEVIVAFSILALALTLLLGSLSGSSRQVRWSADAGRAALLAQSLLDQAGVGEVLSPGRSEGVLEEGRYRWSLDVSPFIDPDRPAAGVADGNAPRLLRLQLTLAWDEGGPRERLQLSTLRLVQPDARDGFR